MLRKVKWETHDGEINGENLVIGNLVFFKGQWSGFLFHVMGLGLTKAEKTLGFPKSKDKFTFYCLRWGITFHSKGSSYLDDLRNVVITSDEPLLRF
jgi:hypothetical protein